MPERTRVLICDDHQIVRQGLRTFLELQEDIEITGEAADGEEAVAKAAVQQPDVVLMDLVMPRLDGIEAIRRIRAQAHASKIIVLTSSRAGIESRADRTGSVRISPRTELPR